MRLRIASRVNVPGSFSEARAKGAVVAQDIVNLSNEVDKDLQRINELDKARRYREASRLTDEMTKKVSIIRMRSLELAEELKAMTAALPEVHPSGARQAALDSISNRLALISRLISYTDQVTHLLEVLQEHFRTGQAPKEDVTKLVNEINAEVRAINAFNSQAGQAMDRFDIIVR